LDLPEPKDSCKKYPNLTRFSRARTLNAAPKEHLATAFSATKEKTPTSNYYQTDTDRNHQHIPLFSPATFHDPIDGIAAVLGRKNPPSSQSVPDSSDEPEKLKTTTTETLTKKVHKTDQIEFSPI
jgi:hypothetical protein